jgi:hypothetical protein
MLIQTKEDNKAIYVQLPSAYLEFWHTDCYVRIETSITIGGETCKETAEARSGQVRLLGDNFLLSFKATHVEIWHLSTPVLKIEQKFGWQLVPGKFLCLSYCHQGFVLSR